METGLIEHIYLLTKKSEVILDHMFAEFSGDKITTIMINDFAVENSLTNLVLQHIGTKQGMISELEQVLLIQAMIQAIQDAVTHQYNHILILNMINYTGAPYPLAVEHLQPSRKFCIYLHQHQHIGYILPSSVFLEIITELSYFIYQASTVIEACIKHNKWDADFCDIIKLPENTTTYVLLQTVEINEDCSDLLQMRENYITQKSQTFVKDIANDKQLLEHIIKNYPYSKVKVAWNHHFNLNLDGYLRLCNLIAKFTYFDQLKIIDGHSTGVVCEYNTVYFDSEFYLQIYPWYRTIFKKSENPYLHFVRHGIGEKLLPNQALFTLTTCCQEYLSERLLAPISSTTVNTSTTNDNSTDPLIYILTRTCNRETLFNQCVESILSQKYHNLRHIVSYDNPPTSQYIKGYSHPYKVVDLIAQKSKLHPNQYIDCLYDYIPKNEPGWVLVIDDDDKFMTPYALHYLKSYLTDPKKLVIWMLHRPDKFIYPANKDLPVVGEIGTCCYLYHSSMIQKGHWGISGIGDFTFFRWAFGRLKERIYIDIPFTCVNYQKQVSGWCAM